MENKVIQKKPHSVIIENREKASCSGVMRVVSSNDNIIILETSEGGLTFSGEKFKITKFDNESGALTFEGIVNNLKYSAGKVPFAKRLFK